MTIDDVPLLVRREIEARILKPFVDALCEKFGKQQILPILTGVIESLAEDAGRQFAQKLPANDLTNLTKILDLWSAGESLDINLLQNDGQRLDFDVTRCRYAEMYERLNMTELGKILSCGRDGCFSKGFNPDITMTRTQTLLEKAPHCDFRFRASKPRSPE